MSQELITIFLGAAPISELRGAIPIALGAFGFSPARAYLLSVFGNFLPVIPLYLILQFGSQFLMAKSQSLNKFFTKLFSYTRTRHQKRFKYQADQSLARPWLEMLTLFVFVAIPLPITGAWSGVLAAFVFGVSPTRTFFSIAAGILVAGLVVLSLSLGVIQIF